MHSVPGRQFRSKSYAIYEANGEGSRTGNVGTIEQLNAKGLQYI
jgi:hypothetical protein